MLHRDAMPVFQYNVDKECIDQFQNLENFLAEVLAIGLGKRASRSYKPELFNPFSLGLAVEFQFIVWLEPGYSIAAHCRLHLSRPSSMPNFKGYNMVSLIMSWELPLDKPEFYSTTLLQEPSRDYLPCIVGLFPNAIKNMTETLVSDYPGLG